ncbi:hypothetical protein ACS0TY_017663 [Phlomoides rotata]
MAAESSSNRGKKESTLVLWNSPRHNDYVEDPVKSPPHSPNNSSTRKLLSSLSESDRSGAATSSQTFAAMVLKTEVCRFSGQKIYLGRGIRFIRSDSQIFLYANSKWKRYFHNRLRPAKLSWTAMYRKQHKKDAAAEFVKRTRRATKKPYSKSIVSATLEVIQKRSEKAEVRDAALREIKERIKKTKDEKKAKKAEAISKKKMKNNVPNGGAVSKGPKIGGGGGKR